ncbi:TPA: hypothetical protein ACH3X1_002407 [Trebouxia sp. C0004]
MGMAGDSLGLEGPWLQGLDASKLLIALLPVWILGAFIGMLLPRPRWLETSTRFGAFWMSSPSGVLLRRFTLAVHGFVIAREVWRHCTIPGTFHAIAAAVWGLLQGKGFDLQLPADMPLHSNAIIKDANAASNDNTAHNASVAAADWHITEADLHFFQHRVEQDAVIPGAGKWEHMTDLRLSSLTYTAWRRRLPDGKTEYKSTTVADDATAEEFMDFYLDDSSRHTWVADRPSNSCKLKIELVPSALALSQLSLSTPTVSKRSMQQYYVETHCLSPFISSQLHCHAHM